MDQEENGLWVWEKKDETVIGQDPESEPEVTWISLTVSVLFSISIIMYNGQLVPQTVTRVALLEYSPFVQRYFSVKSHTLPILLLSLIKFGTIVPDFILIWNWIQQESKVWLYYQELLDHKSKTNKNCTRLTLLFQEDIISNETLVWNWKTLEYPDYFRFICFFCDSIQHCTRAH